MCQKKMCLAALDLKSGTRLFWKESSRSNLVPLRTSLCARAVHVAPARLFGTLVHQSYRAVVRARDFSKGWFRSSSTALLTTWKTLQALVGGSLRTGIASASNGGPETSKVYLTYKVLICEPGKTHKAQNSSFRGILWLTC